MSIITIIIYYVCTFLSLYSYIRLPSLFAKCYFEERIRDYIIAGILMFCVWIQLMYNYEEASKTPYFVWSLLFLLPSYPYLYSKYLHLYHESGKRKWFFLSPILITNVLLWIFLTVNFN